MSDALRDVESELRKPKNPLRRVFDVIQNSVLNSDKEKIKTKIHELNESISSIQQISDIGHNVNDKLNEIVGLVYSPEITVESRLREDIDSLAKYLAVSPTGHEDIDLLGLGHLNILYIALKLVEFEYNRNHEIVNIMIIEEPEAHIHTHIQKTLFDNLKLANNYTQVIMTTHSTHLSEVADIKRVNIMKAEPSFSVIMKPTRGLDEFGKNNLEIKDLSLSSCLERYLDAKRSVLLFSKGVILVEGDGEEILFPAMIKKAFGVSLDEIGIGLINVGNVAFEYLACLFGEERLQRYCAIVTDYDAILEGATKCSEEAEKRGKSRKEKLARLFGANPWVESFFAPYTFEVDFANEKNNRSYIEKIISTHYVDKNTIKRHIANINSSEEKRYDAVLTVATAMRKGWYATVLSSIIDEDVIIPKYLLKALAYASQDVLTSTILLKIACYVLDCYTEDEDIKDLKHKFKNANTEILIKGAMDCFCHLLPDNNLSLLIKYREEIKQT